MAHCFLFTGLSGIYYKNLHVTNVAFAFYVAQSRSKAHHKRKYNKGLKGAVLFTLIGFITTVGMSMFIYKLFSFNSLVLLTIICGILAYISVRYIMPKYRHWTH